MEGQYTHYIIMPNTDAAKAQQITTRYDWQTHTLKDVEKTGKKTQLVTLPTESDLKDDIEAFMAKYSISGSGTKAELVEKINDYCIENGHPTEEVDYTYVVQEIDTTTDHSAKISDMLERHPLYFAPRVSEDGSELCIKSDCTMSELKAIESLTGFSVKTGDEVISYIAGSDKWKVDEE
ncbi:hypothetical protein [Marinobacter sp.]|jgi:hypothetical protein|uniref:hypothetical protein n=1 Tax=Marinobacter sp. TaxID=50741 RepID=UPI000C8FD2C7|nr:hypothetical protein [Marinobacter sp.]MAK51213.1 hypothetical protein [Marinobacter sp.]|tara:strand:+ start:1284 stop:1820 length:537 start_codon:yes stop_codon:yes gene_type:complete